VPPRGLKGTGVAVLNASNIDDNSVTFKDTLGKPVVCKANV